MNPKENKCLSNTDENTNITLKSDGDNPSLKSTTEEDAQ